MSRAVSGVQVTPIVGRLDLGNVSQRDVAINHWSVSLVERLESARGNNDCGTSGPLDSVTQERRKRSVMMLPNLERVISGVGKRAVLGLTSRKEDEVVTPREGSRSLRSKSTPRQLWQAAVSSVRSARRDFSGVTDQESLFQTVAVQLNTSGTKGGLTLKWESFGDVWAGQACLNEWPVAALVDTGAGHHEDDLLWTSFVRQKSCFQPESKANSRRASTCGTCTPPPLAPTPRTTPSPAPLPCIPPRARIQRKSTTTATTSNTATNTATNPPPLQPTPQLPVISSR